jgi:hypothetical protein
MQEFTVFSWLRTNRSLEIQQRLPPPTGVWCWLPARAHPQTHRQPWHPCARRIGWAIAALGALACCLYGAIVKFETGGEQTKLQKLKGFFLWAWIVVFALAVASIRAIVMMSDP